MQHFPALHGFSWSVLALFVKALILSFVQVITRIRSRQFLTPEDAQQFNVAPATQEVPLVQRCGLVWRNDCENHPLFFVLGMLYVALGGSELLGVWLFGSYAVSRYLHTWAYLNARQPWRALFYLSGLLILIALAIQIAILMT